jgi:hypothetical protein
MVVSAPIEEVEFEREVSAIEHALTAADTQPSAASRPSHD